MFVVVVRSDVGLRGLEKGGLVLLGKIYVFL